MMRKACHIENGKKLKMYWNENQDATVSIKCDVTDKGNSFGGKPSISATKTVNNGDNDKSGASSIER